MSDYKLTLSSGLGEEVDTRLTAALMAEFKRSTDILARPTTKLSKVGDRSAEVGIVGQLLLTFLTSGAAVALINALKPLFERAPSSTIEIQRPDASSLKITSSMISHADLTALLVKQVGK